jgi:hypothetical protein
MFMERLWKCVYLDEAYLWKAETWDKLMERVAMFKGVRKSGFFCLFISFGPMPRTSNTLAR